MANFLDFIRDPEERRKLLQNAMQSVNRGIVTNTLGAPVDSFNALANLARAGVGYAGHKTGLLSSAQMPELNEEPIGGSEWIGNKLEKAGLLGSYRNPMAEAISGGLLGPATTAAVAQRAPQIMRSISANTGGQRVTISGKTSPGLETPNALQRLFKDDYPSSIGQVAGERLRTSIDGAPLRDGLIVGRQTVGGADVSAPIGGVDSVARSLGVAPSAVPGKELGKGFSGSYRPVLSDNGRFQGSPQIKYLDQLDAQGTSKVVNHEVGHLFSDIVAGNKGITAPGTTKELATIYSDLNKKLNGSKQWTPSADGYNGKAANEEMWAEAFRAYLENPNYIKSVAPRVAAEIRKRVNTHPQLSKVIQFNSAAGGGLLGVSVMSDDDGS